MPKRNVPLAANQVYWVKRADGKHYKVWSKTVLDSRIERGLITDEDRVMLQRTYI